MTAGSVVPIRRTGGVRRIGNPPRSAGALAAAHLAATPTAFARGYSPNGQLRSVERDGAGGGPVGGVTDHIGGHHRVHRRPVGAVTPRPATVGGEQREQGPLRPVAVVHDRVGLDGHGPLVVARPLACRSVVDGGLGLVGAEARWSWTVAVDADGVLGEEPAVGGDEPDGVAVLAPEPVDDGGDGVADVVVGG